MVTTLAMSFKGLAKSSSVKKRRALKADWLVERSSRSNAAAVVETHGT
jgi:hypothetical protein